ncbi:MAG TPA: M20/M25/M40 family metallo-hydrolase [Sphingobium sp.]
MRLSFVMAPLVLAAAPASAQQADLSQVFEQGLNRSTVMPLAQELTDGIGGRLTNSPSMRKAEAWALDKFKGWGLSNVRREGFAFGRGWFFSNAGMTMTAPRLIHMRTIPVAWTPGTKGAVKGEIIVAPMAKIRDFAAWKGKLKGKIVLISMPGTGDEPDKAPFLRFTADDIRKMDTYTQPSFDPDSIEQQAARRIFERRLDDFLASEGALGWARISTRDGGLVHGTGYNYEVGKTARLPAFEIATEDYRRLARLAKTGPVPVVEMSSDAHYDDSDVNAYNIIAEIPGSDPQAGYVMAGAHLDSWVAGDGAADNAAGSAMVMEAARILQATGVKPRRTIRFVLWAAEEQGLLGSRAYIEKYLAIRPAGPADEILLDRLRWVHRFPITTMPGYGDLKAYFNIDNGSGKLRGIYADNNVGAVPLLKSWLAPFESLGAGAVAIKTTGSTDHFYMQSIGLPAFQFIQDPLDYNSRLHHTDVDTFDHLKGDDMRQGATVLAGVLLQAANSDKELPREALPTGEALTDPFKYRDPGED